MEPEVKKESNRGKHLEQFHWKPGQSGNPNGRPKGTISIKDQIRWHLEENPQAVKDIVEHFVKNNRELLWTMLEGSPKSTNEVKVESLEISVTGEDLLLAQQLLEQRRSQTSSIEGDGTLPQPVGRKVQD